MEQMTKELTSYLRGWKSYFGCCETPSVLQALDQWIRRRLRSVIWKQRKRRAGWSAVYRPLLHTAFPIAYFDSPRTATLVRALTQLTEPPYADPHVRRCGRGGRVTVPYADVMCPVSHVIAQEREHPAEWLT